MSLRHPYMYLLLFLPTSNDRQTDPGSRYWFTQRGSYPVEPNSKKRRNNRVNNSGVEGSITGSRHTTVTHGEQKVRVGSRIANNVEEVCVSPFVLGSVVIILVCERIV